MSKHTHPQSAAGTSSEKRTFLVAVTLSLPLAVLALSVIVFDLGTLFRAVSVVALFIIQSAVIAYVYRRPGTGAGGRSGVVSAEEAIFDPVTEERLQALEDAGKLVAGSLRLEDMFRLAVSRADEIVSLGSPVLVLLGADGKPVRELGGSGSEIPDERNGLLAERTVRSRSVEYEASDQADGGAGTVAVPLSRRGEVFAVIIAGLTPGSNYEKRTTILLEAVAERLAPLISASVAFDATERSALADALTGLPNLRAFETVLENRVAEAHRFKSDSDLIVAALDIRGFSDFNSSFGHAAGDRLLVHVSRILKNELRKMDFLARPGGDEFLIVMPAANADTRSAIGKRLANAFNQQPFTLSEGQKHFVAVEIGLGVFGSACSTAEEMLRTARRDRDMRKPGRSNQVLRFPTQGPESK